MRKGVVAVLVRDGNVLVAKRHPANPDRPSVWECPGGKVDPGEDPRQAVMRELKEELGVDAMVAPIGQVNIAGWLVHGFICWTHDEPEIKEPNKCEEIKWVPLDEAPTIVSGTAGSELIQLL